jgi:hypothetical protein
LWPCKRTTASGLVAATTGGADERNPCGSSTTFRANPDFRVADVRDAEFLDERQRPGTIIVVHPAATAELDG